MRVSEWKRVHCNIRSCIVIFLLIHSCVAAAEFTLDTVAHEKWSLIHSENLVNFMFEHGISALIKWDQRIQSKESSFLWRVKCVKVNVFVEHSVCLNRFWLLSFPHSSHSIRINEHTHTHKYIVWYWLGVNQHWKKLKPIQLRFQ